MRPTFLPAVLLLGAVACGHDPFPPFRYQVFGGNLALDTDETFTLTLNVRVTEYTEDGSRIVGIRSEGGEIEVGTWSVGGI